ncbi:MAG: hypothetical protein IJJ06_00560 [Mogibacterium sp.]|nr:hypothetical protein [Mogibacterium sp.]
MQLDFHYYATYCAATIAGYTHDESLQIAYSDQFTDCCSRTLLKKLNGPLSAATTQLQLELMDARTDITGLQDITRIWAPFHFLPGDLDAKVEKFCGKRYLHKYRLICNTNSALLKDTVELARGRSMQAAGIAMHVLADTWAHRYFAGTPTLAINNVNYYFYELVPEGDDFREVKIKFNNDPRSVDDPEKGVYTNSLYQSNENSIMNLGHGRAGHFPDYGYARYKYLPAWGGYKEILKDNPSDYYHAFCQMVFALRCLRNGEVFETGVYDFDAVRPWEDDIRSLLEKRQTDASADWKALAEKISGCEVEDFDMDKYQNEYTAADEESKDGTFLGRFIIAALAQKSMVTNRIFTSGNPAAGVSVDLKKGNFSGIKDFQKLVKEYGRRQIDV